VVTNKKLCGGYCFKRFKGQPDAELVELPVSQKVSVSLQQGEVVLAPAVATGDSVKAGDVIGKNDEQVGSSVCAPITGVIESIDEQSGRIAIKGDGSSEWTKLDGCGKDFASMSVDQIEDLLYRSGVTSQGRDGIPTRHKTSVITPDQVDDLIINGVDDDVYSISPSALLTGDGVANFSDGVKILKKLMPNARVHVAFTSKQKELAKQIEEVTSSIEGVTVYMLKAMYPQGHDEVLINTLTDGVFPHGRTSANVGAVVVDLQAVLHARDAVVEGKPVIDRVIALCGQGLNDAKHVRVRIGTPISEVLKGLQKADVEVRLVANSVMTGAVLDPETASVDASLSALIALPEGRDWVFMAFVRPGFSEDAYSRTLVSNILPTKKNANANLKGEERPCVQCGYCQEACPMGIIPHLLFKYSSRDIIEEELLDLRIFDCIDCQLCSYVCPSKIDVGRHIGEGKKKMLEEGIDNSRNTAGLCLKGLESEDAS
jgi:electron transport complex protein RnfC